MMLKSNKAGNGASTKANTRSVHEPRMTTGVRITRVKMQRTAGITRPNVLPKIEKIGNAMPASNNNEHAPATNNRMLEMCAWLLMARGVA